jgi:hypothetical protein
MVSRNDPSIEYCPRCGEAVDPSAHFTLARSRPISQIECECGYIGLPVIFVKEED